MSQNAWFTDEKYQDYWQHQDMIMKHYEEMSKIYDEYSLAYWRSVAVGLHHENQMLHQLVQQLLGLKVNDVANANTFNNNIPDKECKPKLRKKKSVNAREFGMKEKTSSAQENVELEETQSENSLDQYLKFVEETERHREERERNREKGVKHNPTDHEVTDDILDKADDIAMNFEQLKKEMSELYGRDALKVCCILCF